MKIEKYIRPMVKDLKPYSSARDEYFGASGIFLDANENPYDFEYSRYPDPYQRTLKAEIAKWRNVNSEQIFLGNGSDEVIDLLVKASCERKKHRIISLDPSYGMYKVSSAINEIEIDLVPMDDNLEVDKVSLFSTLNDSHRLVFICSPNNPNGGLIESKLIEKLLKRVNGFVVVDEAYIDFSDSESWSNRLSNYDNLIILQTMSKSMGAAGIRLGIGLMNPYVVSMLNKIKPPYNISSPNQEQALSRILEMPKVLKSIKQVKAQRNRMLEMFKSLGFVTRVFDSSANFLLVKFNNHREVLKTLTDNNIIARDRSSNTNCEDCIRFSVGTEVENDALIKVLNEINN